MKTVLIAISSMIFALGCGNNASSEGSAEPSTAVEPAAPEPPAPPVANALGVGLVEVTEETLRASLSIEGWRINSVSSSGGNMNAIAHYNDTQVEIGLGRPIHPGRKSDLEAEGVPMHNDGDNSLYVKAEEDPELAQRVLDALMGQ